MVTPIRVKTQNKTNLVAAWFNRYLRSNQPLKHSSIISPKDICWISGIFTTAAALKTTIKTVLIEKTLVTSFPLQIKTDTLFQNKQRLERKLQLWNNVTMLQITLKKKNTHTHIVLTLVSYLSWRRLHV